MDIVLFKNKKINHEEFMFELDFYVHYTLIHHKFFIKLKHEWEMLSPDRKIFGLCSEIDSITGVWKDISVQKAWSWGDGRALGLWSNHLITGIIHDEEIEINPLGQKRVVNLRAEYKSYCDVIFRQLEERYKLNGGHFPFIADISTNKASGDSRNVTLKEGERSFSDLFCSAGFMQYGLLTRNHEITDKGLKILLSVSDAIKNAKFVVEPHNPNNPPKFNFQGAYMILLGVCVDVLKSIVSIGEKEFSSLRKNLFTAAVEMTETILSKFYSPESGILWEFNTLDDKPFKDGASWIADPGHGAECAGFIAEFASLLKTENDMKQLSEKYIEAASRISLYMSENGYSRKGLMYKRINLLKETERGVFDNTVNGVKLKTAPWWNVREHSAASLRLYHLRGDERHLVSYSKAQNATYMFYPNKLIDGLMTQTLNAETAETLPLNPATANFDPMHDQRARDREIEVLKSLIER